MAQFHLPGPAGMKHLSNVALDAIFRRLVDELVRQSPTLKSRLRPLKGHRAFISFGKPGVDLPPKVSDKQKVDHVIAFLKTLTPRSFVTAATEYPAERFLDGRQYSADGTLSATICRIPYSTSSLWKALGFDLGLSYNREITQTDVVGELQRIVRDHDEKPADLLIVTCGSATKQGVKFASDAVCGALLDDLVDPLGGYVPKNLGRVAFYDYARPGQPVRWLHGGPLV